MKKRLFITIAVIMGIGTLVSLNAQSNRIELSLDKEWSFYLGDDSAAIQPSFNDTDWRKLDVPHDWSIEGEYNRLHPTGRGGGYLPAGIGWYRKQLHVPDAAKGKRLFIEFDGVMANSDVWVNGTHLGHRPYGYSAFQYELTRLVKTGQTNILTVRVDNSKQPASRWYAGAGIYRHVRLICVNPIHMEHWGHFVTTPEVTDKKAIVAIEANVKNQSNKTAKLTVQTIVTAPDGKTFTSPEMPLQLESGKNQVQNIQVTVQNPKRWDIETPNMYQATTYIRQGKEILDEQQTSFGIRTFRFDAQTGFYLNDKNIKILGVCLHHDGGPLGAAVPKEAWRRRFETLKKLGVNGIRTAHNPMSPEFYDLCDEMGFLVMNESFDTWTASKPNGTQGYNKYFREWWEADTRAMVMRDRNHPSIILYSVGNEIRDRLDRPEGRQDFINQRDLVHSLDPTRPVTLALFRPNQMKVYDNGFSELMDIVGQNYREQELVDAWHAKKDRKVIGTENGHTRETWLILRDNPFMSGQFLWTGIDYLGEANWPAISWSAALLDRNAQIKPTGYQRQSWWSNTPMVKMVRNEFNLGNGELVPDWTPVDFGTYDEGYVYVYSNAEEVELFLNDNSLGKQTVPNDASPLFWNVPFEPGSLVAVAYKQGKEVAKDCMQTAEEAIQIRLTPEKNNVRNDWEDLVYVHVDLTDANGITNPNYNPVLNFKVSGPGKLVAVDNGYVQSHEKYVTNTRSSHRGKAIAIIQATADQGDILLEVQAEGFEPANVHIQASPKK
ncbi:MAG: glycoside hydrolase family 2 TIM barrel-domain containing protein [Bacteroidales bacterium]|nr:glycoside hydrolase family 2 TIM barrel-domain containing protein [Bacteroidales bacterium]MDD3165958.1 glycoside hydrolase family 2 TIM barrel-domain containing protein [Bacteroidales bacterium]MDD4769890.1 glycoside hydrolase family 2 TIM barrel-domain containing protein [Bacteroidales bacterium]